MREYQEREIYAYGRYINCQILNWQEGPPPRYLICNPLDANYREEFLARQGMGTWMRCDLREPTGDIDALEEALTDLCDAWDAPGKHGKQRGKFDGNVTNAHKAARDTLARHGRK